MQVETIGDAYLLVGGVPEYSRDHADRVIAMAFDMIEVCKTVISPADGQPIQVMVALVSSLKDILFLFIPISRRVFYY